MISTSSGKNICQIVNRAIAKSLDLDFGIFIAQFFAKQNFNFTKVKVSHD